MATHHDTFQIQRVGLLFLITAVSHGFATAANKMPSALDSLSRAWLRLLF